MIMKKVFLVSIIVSLLCVVFNFPAYATQWILPQLEVNLTNIGECTPDDYYLDILVHQDILETKGVTYDSLNDLQYDESYRNMPLYLYNEDNMLASNIRSIVLPGSLKGKYLTKTSTSINHGFIVYDPKVIENYKVILQFESGELFVSKDKYSYSESNPSIVIDFEKDMKEVYAKEPELYVKEPDLYAKEPKLYAKKAEVIYGDLNSDGVVNSLDYALLKRYTLSINEELTQLISYKVADVNGDGAINSTDYALIKRFILGVIRKFPVEETGISPEVIEGNNRFAFDIMKKLSEDDENDNTFISPLSISTALTMTYQGARANTRYEMAKVLGYEGINDKELNKTYKYLLEYLKKVDDKVELNINNSIWAREGYEFNEDFMAVNKDVFDAYIELMDFSKADSADTINNWISDATKEKITKMVDSPIDASVMMYLINAIYFKGTWTEEFDEERTQISEFNTVDGKKRDVYMMNKTGTVDYGKGDGYEAIRLPYGNGKTSMYIILPSVDSSVNELVSEMDISKWNTIKKSIKETEEVVVNLPRFKIEYGIKELSSALESLGMIDAFTDTADFSGIRNGLNISRVLHKAVIEVNEEGSEAAAVTVVGVRITAAPLSIVFNANRPFLFLIEEDETDTILFMGKLCTMESEVDYWKPSAPLRDLTEFSLEKDSEGNYKAVITMTFLSGGYRSSSNNKVVSASDNVFIAGAEVQQSSLIGTPVVPRDIHRYDLGKLEPGTYNFDFRVNGSPFDVYTFTVE